MILMKDIIQDGHPTLKEIAKKVNVPVSNDDLKTLKDMLSYLFMSQDKGTAEKLGLRAGVGIAAPQIGVSKRMFCILCPDEETEDDYYVLALINPEIKKKSAEMIYLPGGEGCLSVAPNISGIVPRHQKIEVSAYALDFDTDKLVKKNYTFENYVAIVFQHEYDHLDGILFTDKVVTEIPEGCKPID